MVVLVLAADGKEALVSVMSGIVDRSSGSMETTEGTRIVITTLLAFRKTVLALFFI